MGVMEETALGKKLFLSLLVRVLIVPNLLPDEYIILTSFN